MARSWLAGRLCATWLVASVVLSAQQAGLPAPPVLLGDSPATVEPVTVDPVILEPVAVEPVTIEPLTIEMSASPLVKDSPPLLSGRGEPPPASYLLGPGDEITVSVLETEEVSRSPQRIGLGGELHLQMVGRIQAAGLTVEELEAAVAQQLRRYVHDPHVAVAVTQFHSQPVSVIGAVNNPGVHQLEGRKTLIEVLSLAGGLRTDAGHQVKITRRVEWGELPLPGVKTDPSGQFAVAEVSLGDLLQARLPEHNIAIQPHDVVTVPRAEMVYVIGAVHRSGGFVLQEREGISVLQALALAGGTQETAKQSEAKILRRSEEGGERREIAVNLKQIMAGRVEDALLQREDILFVPRSGGKAIAQRALQTALHMGAGVAIWRVGR